MLHALRSETVSEGLKKRQSCGCGQRHDERVKEFDFRYSNRVALGIDDTARADIATKGIVGKRLTYRRTVQT